MMDGRGFQFLFVIYKKNALVEDCECVPRISDIS